jgi:hypothetical protein
MPRSACKRPAFPYPMEKSEDYGAAINAAYAQFTQDNPKFSLFDGVHVMFERVQVAPPEGLKLQKLSRGELSGPNVRARSKCFFNSNSNAPNIIVTCKSSSLSGIRTASKVLAS